MYYVTMVFNNDWPHQKILTLFAMVFLTTVYIFSILPPAARLTIPTLIAKNAVENSEHCFKLSGTKERGIIKEVQMRHDEFAKSISTSPSISTIHHDAWEGDVYMKSGHSGDFF